MISAKGKKDPECVKVVVRCRPMSRREVEDNRQQIVSINIDTGEVTVRNPESDIKEAPKPFTFDQVFDSNCEQEHVFQTTAQPIVDSVLQGYNGTVFAYGQTGTGKTHTMEGLWDPPEQRGIIPRSFARIFSEIDDTHDQNFLVRASFLEIYNEEVRDLLAKDPKNKLDLKEDNDRGVYVKDLTSYVVKGATEMENVLLAGKKNRSVGATLMNQDSSRSHSIFTIVIESSAEGSDGSRHIRAGKLNLVDLAGSERQSKTGATGDRLKEVRLSCSVLQSLDSHIKATKINLSLSALGNVISALVDSKSHHIPYRDSKLTRLLQDSLGGNTKTVMVANIGPADYNYDETISTLRSMREAPPARRPDAAASPTGTPTEPRTSRTSPRSTKTPKTRCCASFRFDRPSKQEAARDDARLQEEIARLKSMLESQQNDPEVRGLQGVLDESEERARGLTLPLSSLDRRW